jgi:thioredoxin-dependent peroxiredoxin
MAKITLKGNPIRTNGNLPSVGAKAPDFQLVDGDLNDRTLKDYRGKRKMIYIVPSLDTSVCSLSTKKFNDQIKSHPEVSVIVVSTDLPFAQKRICSQEHVANIVPLSMMRSKEFAKVYGVLIEDGPLAGICARAVVVLDENDNIIYSELVPEITQEPNYDKALQALLKK